MDKQLNIKRFHTAEFKRNVVLELFKKEETISQICSKFSIHPTQARRWKELADGAIENCFSGHKSISNILKQKDQLIDELYRQVGQLKVELDWVKKKIGLAT
jgi:transposase